MPPQDPETGPFQIGEDGRGHGVVCGIAAPLGSGRACRGVAERARIPPLIPTHLWELQETDSALQGLARGWLCALLHRCLASIPYVQFQLGGFRSVSLELSGTIQSFWFCSRIYFCRLRCLAWIPNSKQNFAGGVNCQFWQT